jgi:phosphoribosylformylglycinamidine synthase subunit PurL
MFFVQQLELSLPVVDGIGLTDDEVTSLLKKHKLRLRIDELLYLQQHILKRPPTVAECVLWSIQGSEHCSYKSSKLYLQKLCSEAPHVILGPTEDAGVVAVATDNQGYRYGLVVSHESHNHPSQLVPYEGAATGVGGNVRDVVCMGAEVIAIGNSLRFGAIHRSQTKVIQEGVVAGIAGYANPIGVPTIAGDVYYHPQYNNNCLVTVVTLGIVREDELIHSYVPAGMDEGVFILVGKATDGSGFAGASFASQTLQDNTQNRSAIQEPNAFLKNHLLKANYALFAQLKKMNCLHQVGFKDLGAGGIACASIEMAAASGLGAYINLDKVPTLSADLPPEVLLCSETQERFLWVVPKKLTPLVLDHYNKIFELGEMCLGAKAQVIGAPTADGWYTVTYRQAQLVHIPAKEFSAQLVYQRPSHHESKTRAEPKLPSPQDYNQLFLNLLAHEHIASRAPIFEQYDKQVQGRTILAAGEADAGVLQPFNDESYPAEIRNTGIALSLDQCPGYNLIDPYWGAVNAVVESARNVVAVGATPLAITDCLCFGNPEKAEHFWSFTEAIRGLIDACKAIGLKNEPHYSLPIIAGNVSFYNESTASVIPPSPMISCIGGLVDVSKALTFSLKQTDSLLLLVGERFNECGGGVYYAFHGELGAYCPKPNLEQIGNELRAVQEVIEKELILAAHDIADGGIAIALAEMSFKNEIGVKVEIPGTLLPSQQLFSESGGFVLEANQDSLAAIERCFATYAIPLFVIGRTQSKPQLEIASIINLPIAQAKKHWQNGLRNKLCY